MDEVSLITRIVISLVFLLMFAICAFCTWRIFGMYKILKRTQKDRDGLLEERAKQSDRLRLKGIEIDELKKKMHSDIMFRIVKTGEAVIGELLSNIEKKIILVALNRPDVRAEMKNSHTSNSMRGTYENLKEKIEKSFND